jgi:hypothetical protein
MDRRGLTRDEVCDRGQKLLEERLTATEIEKHRGQLAAVDVISGEMAFGKTGLIAVKELEKRVAKPVAYLGRVGYPSAYRIGGGRGTTKK